MLSSLNPVRSREALNAALVLHDELLADDNMAGYDGSTEAYYRLLEEVVFIARNLERCSHDSILDTFWANQLEIVDGNREVDYYA